MEIFNKLFKTNSVNKELSDSYKSLYKTPAGKVVIDDLLRFTKVTSPSFVPGNADTTAYNEGMRRVGLRILSMVEGTPNETKNLTPNDF